MSDFQAPTVERKEFPPAAYNVVDVIEKGTKELHGSTLAKLYLTLANAEGNHLKDVYFQPKVENKPEVGDALYGTLKLGDYGWRFHREQQGQENGSERPQQAFGQREPVAGQTTVPRDNTQARIEYQAMSKVAASLLHTAAVLNILKSQDSDGLMNAHKNVTELLVSRLP